MILSAIRPVAIQGPPGSPYRTQAGASGIATFAQTWDGWTTAFASGWTNPDRTITPEGFVIPGNKSYAWRDDGPPIRRLQWQMRSTVLGDVYFGCDATGAGTMFRLDARRGVIAGFATTQSWTSWNAPMSGFLAQPNTWYTVTLDLTATTARVVIVGNAGGGHLGDALHAPRLRLRFPRRWGRRRDDDSPHDRVRLTPPGVIR